MALYMLDTDTQAKIEKIQDKLQGHAGAIENPLDLQRADATFQSMREKVTGKIGDDFELVLVEAVGEARLLRLVRVGEPSALGQRLVEDLLQAGRRVGDDLLGVPEALEVAQSRDGRVHLLGGVAPFGHRTRL